MIIKNSRIRQYLAHNRYFILFGVIGIILLLLILGNLSEIERENQEQKRNEVKNTTTTSNVYKPQETVISGGNVSAEKQEENTNIIEEFVQYCNKGEIQKAYELLSQDCKNAIYPDIQTFKANYVDKKFTKQRQYSMQSWYSDGEYTYKVVLTEDILSTGKATTTDTIEEYYTIVKVNGETKLNINNYIKKSTINKQGGNENISILVASKEIYKDYEIYTLQVTNNTQNKILLDSRKETDTIYIQGRTGAKYRALAYELSELDLVVNPGNSKRIQIKFNKTYNPSLRIVGMNFTNIILNYDEYSQMQDKTKYNDITSVSVEF